MTIPKRKLGELGEFRNGLNYSKENFGSGLKVISVKDFGDRWRPDLTILDEISPAGMRIANSNLQRGDIIFVRSNGNKELIGRSMLIEDDLEDVSFSGFCIRFRPSDPNTNSRFLSLFFRTSLFRRVLSQQGKGTNINNLNQSILERMEVPYPQPIVQDKITEVASAYDDLIETNRRRIALLEEAARLLYREWFVHFRFPGHEHVPLTDGLPVGWEVKRVDELADLRGGKQHDNDAIKESGRYPVFGGNGIQGYSERNTHKDFVIAFGRVGAYCGSVHWSYEGAWINNNASGLVPKEYPELFLHHMLACNFTNYRKGAAQPFIPNGVLATIPFKMPPAGLASAFCDYARDFRLQQINLEKQNQNLAQARDLLLPRLMNGEIAV